eukprot:9755118-Ditylum_brightwellii.AAC.2
MTSPARILLPAQTTTDNDPQHFHEYTETADSWECQLLAGCEFIEGWEELIYILPEDTDIFLVTDGGAADRLRYFG